VYSVLEVTFIFIYDTLILTILHYITISASQLICWVNYFFSSTLTKSGLFRDQQPLSGLLQARNRDQQPLSGLLQARNFIFNFQDFYDFAGPVDSFKIQVSRYPVPASGIYNLQVVSVNYQVLYTIINFQSSNVPVTTLQPKFACQLPSLE